MSPERRIETRKLQQYGATGVIGVDGILTPEQKKRLNTLQQEAVVAIFTYLDDWQPGQPWPSVEMATGIGKGHIIHLTLEEQVRRMPNKKILVISGSKKRLATQTHEALAKYQDGFAKEDTSEDTLGEESTLYKTGELGDSDPKVNVEVSIFPSVQARRRRYPDLIRDYGLVIADEMHEGGTAGRKRLLQESRQAAGFSATATRYSGENKSPEDYGFTVIKEYPLYQAQVDRLLPPLLGVQVDVRDKIREIPMTDGGKIDFVSLSKILKNNKEIRPYLVEQVVPLLTAPTGRPMKGMGVVNYVWEAVHFAHLFHEMGIKAGIAVQESEAARLHTYKIPANDSVERYNLDHEEDDAIQLLLSPRILGTGFNAPVTELFFMGSPTDSPIRYRQAAGRDARRADGKAYGLVVDAIYATRSGGFTFNMAKMDENVVQLSNGMLYLGHPADRDRFATLPPQGDVFPIEELRSEGVKQRHLSMGEFILKPFTISSRFNGNPEELFDRADSFFDRTAEEHPEYMEERIYTNGQIVHVVTIAGLRALAEEFRRQGVVPTDKTLADVENFSDRERIVVPKRTEKAPLEKIKPHELAISYRNLTEIFDGNPDEVSRLVGEFIKQTQKEHPEWVVKRVANEYEVLALTNEEAKVELIMHLVINGINLKE